MSDSGLCFFLGFFSGYIFKIFVRKSCQTSTRRIDTTQLEINSSTQLPNDLNTEIVLSQPQRGRPMRREVNIPIAEARVIASS